MGADRRVARAGHMVPRHRQGPPTGLTGGGATWRHRASPARLFAVRDTCPVPGGPRGRSLRAPHSYLLCGTGVSTGRIRALLRGAVCRRIRAPETCSSARIRGQRGNYRICFLWSINRAQNLVFQLFLPLPAIFSPFSLLDFFSTSRAASTGGVVGFLEARILRFPFLRRNVTLIHL